MDCHRLFLGHVALTKIKCIPIVIHEAMYPARATLQHVIKFVVFANKVGKNSRYFVGVFNKTIIPLAPVYILIIANSYPTRARGIIVNYSCNYYRFYLNTFVF